MNIPLLLNREINRGGPDCEKTRQHRKYLTKLSNWYRAFINSKERSLKMVQKKHETIALSEVMVFIEEHL